MMSLIRPFGALQNTATLNIAVTASEQKLTLAPAGIGYRSVRLCNLGTQTIFVTFTGTADITTAMPIPAGAVEILILEPDVKYISVIASATGSTLYATIGQGI